MRKKEFRYLVLWVFLSGIIIIVFLQVLSGYNINRLVRENNSVFNELLVQNQLRQLQADILTLESDIRGAVITNDRRKLNTAGNKIQAIQETVGNLHKYFIKKASAPSFNSLNLLVAEQIQYSNELIAQLRLQNKTAFENLVGSNRGNEI